MKTRAHERRCIPNSKVPMIKIFINLVIHRRDTYRALHALAWYNACDIKQTRSFIPCIALASPNVILLRHNVNLGQGIPV